MSDDGLHQRHLSRRELLRIAGLGGLAAAGVGIAGPLVLPSGVAATSLQDDTPEGFLAAAYTQRVQTINTGAVDALDAFYDPASTTLRAAEKERSKLFRNNLSPRWQNSPILSFGSTVQLLDLAVSGSTATARLNEITSVVWIPRPMVLSPEAQAGRQKNPAAYQPTSPRGPRGELTTRFATKHEVTLVKGGTGWRLAKDNYDERHLFGASPDFVPGSWAEAGWGPGPFPKRPEPTPVTSTVAGEEEMVRALGSTPYYRANAVQNAHNLAFGVGAGFCYFDSCGGDCANFVSQCLTAGNQRQDGLWRTYSG